MADGLRLLVPYTRSPASIRGLDAACRLAKSEENSHIHAVYVVEVDRRMSLDSELPEDSEIGERCLAEAEETARRHKVHCDGDILQARDAGHAIVDEAVERGVHMIVLGAPRNANDAQSLDLGKTVEYVLRHAPCEVVLVRDGATP